MGWLVDIINGIPLLYDKVGLTGILFILFFIGLILFIFKNPNICLTIMNKEHKVKLEAKVEALTDKVTELQRSVNECQVEKHKYIGIIESQRVQLATYNKIMQELLEAKDDKKD